MATPSANSSRLGSGKGSSRSANARAAAIDSVKLISAMPTAGGHRAWTSARSGHVTEGSPVGTAPTVATPCAGRSSSAEAATAAATATSGAGTRGTKCSSPKISTTIAAETASVTRDVCGRCARIAKMSRKKPVFSMCTPSSFGNWSTTITNPMPDLNPTSTGSEMKFATKPSRSTQAASSTSPTITASVAAATSRFDPGPVRHGAQRRPGQDRDRRRRADAERARSAEQRVDDHGHERCVQSHLHGQPGDRRVRHGFRDDDRRSREAGDHVGAQPFALVAAQCDVAGHRQPPSWIATATRNRPASMNTRPAIHGLASVCFAWR